MKDTAVKGYFVSPVVTEGNAACRMGIAAGEKAVILSERDGKSLLMFGDGTVMFAPTKEVAPLGDILVTSWAGCPYGIA